jgi:hypothetical protein
VSFEVVKIIFCGKQQPTTDDSPSKISENCDIHTLVFKRLAGGRERETAPLVEKFTKTNKTIAKQKEIEEVFKFQPSFSQTRNKK